MKPLTKTENGYFINNKKNWNPSKKLSIEIISEAFNFSYDMCFEKNLKHRKYRSGGTEKRSNGKIFIQTFQGKIAEFYIYQKLAEFGLYTERPCLDKWELGKWDEYDLELNNSYLSIKSTKFFGNLLLLESKDWNHEGKYIPNLNDNSHSPDFIILVRISPDGEKLMAINRFLYSNKINKNTLENIIKNEIWECDCPGFISKQELIKIINKPYVLPKNSLLNGKIKMDAENYYVQAGDFHPLDEFKKLFK